MSDKTQLTFSSLVTLLWLDTDTYLRVIGQIEGDRLKQFDLPSFVHFHQEWGYKEGDYKKLIQIFAEFKKYDYDLNTIGQSKIATRENTLPVTYGIGHLIVSHGVMDRIISHEGYNEFLSEAIDLGIRFDIPNRDGRTAQEYAKIIDDEEGHGTSLFLRYMDSRNIYEKLSGNLPIKHVTPAEKKDGGKL